MRTRTPPRNSMSGAPRVVLANKPYGVLCQFTSGEGRATLAGIVPVRDVYPAGRLDADSEGLVVLTGDGALQARIADPRRKLGKRYLVQVEGTPDDEAIRRLSEGIVVDGRRTLPARVARTGAPSWLWPRDPPIRERRSIPAAWLAMELFEGRNRQVRRMTAAVGLPALRLVRLAVGPWTVEGLPPGAWRWAEVPPALQAAGARAKAPRERVL